MERSQREVAESLAMGCGCALYLDCQSGIAGDMLVGALLDLGADEVAMRRALASLPVDGFEIAVTRVKKAGIDCCDFAVLLDREHENHDHDMAYLHGTGHAAHEHDHEHGHRHGHEGHHHHHHEHRGPVDIARIIDAADMTAGARALAHRTFDILAAAEAKAHAVPIDQVHFHEVGAVDSIVDIVAASVLLDSLGVSRVIVPVLVDGHGTVRCQHGIIPVPAPATLNICIASGLPLQQVDVEGELVTPTGAALVAALDPQAELPARYAVRQVGMGAGKRSYERPSLLRALLIQEVAGAEAPASECARQVSDATPEQIVKLECDIDDSTPEVLAYAADRLREAGAREVHWLPLYTKKGRPAFQLQVISVPEDVERLELIIFRETSTIGIRRVNMDRTVLERSFERVQTPWGAVSVKRAVLPDGSERIAPELDDCAALARREGIPLQQVMDAARLASRA